MGRIPLVLGAAAAALLFCGPAANAAFPGANGRIAVSGVKTLNPDGTGETPLPNGSNPAWSPDGTKIAFDRTGDIHVMNADGSNVTQLTSDTVNPAAERDPTWSPDGLQLAFESDRAGSVDLWKMNVDGSGQVRLTTDPATDADPTWSPDGTKIAFTSDRENYVCDDPESFPECVPRPTFQIFTIDPSGSNPTKVTHTQPYFYCDRWGTDDVAPEWSPAGDQLAYMRFEFDNCVYETNIVYILTTGWGLIDYEPDYFADMPFVPPAGGPAWSPDGRQIAFQLSRELRIYERGVGTRTITGCCYIEANWQPIPVNAYARPKGASPMYLSLVPAYAQCMSSNRQHGTPLSFQSCAPPIRASTNVTFGTPDANGLTPNGIGSAILTTKADNLATPGDESDVRLKVTVTDVRLASDLSDYAGQLEARPTLRITDKDNTPSPGGSGAATTKSITFPYAVACTATAATTIGSTCATTTTAEAVLPGSITGGRRAVWELLRFDVSDGSGAMFLRPGVFVP